MFAAVREQLATLTTGTTTNEREAVWMTRKFLIRAPN